MHKIIEAQPGPNAHLRLQFEDKSGVVDLRPILAKGGVFQPLWDSVIFEQVSIGGGGRFIEWPGEVDLCADALYEKLEQV